MATVALEGLDLAMPDDAVAATLTRRAEISCRPAGLLQGHLTLGLSTIVLKKFIQTEARLKLEIVWRHVLVQREMEFCLQQISYFWPCLPA